MANELLDGTTNPCTLMPKEEAETAKPSTQTCQAEAGAEKGAEILQISNNEFIVKIFPSTPDDVNVAVCSKKGDPNNGGWVAVRSNPDVELPHDQNNYLNCSSFKTEDNESFSVQKSQFSGLHFLLLDDLGTKIPLTNLGDFGVSWMIETSPENFQAGIILTEPITGIDEAERLQKALIDGGLSDPGASGVSRWARLPNAINGKEKHKVEGKPFQCKHTEWHPEKRYTVEEIVLGLHLQLSPQKSSRPVKESDGFSQGSDDGLSSLTEENPVLAALKERELYKTDLGSGKHDITCPWVEEHTDQLDDGAAYFEPSEEFPNGGFRCHHSHGDKYNIHDLNSFLSIDSDWVQGRPIIYVTPGEINNVVESAEQALADQGKYFQVGGLIVTISVDPVSGNPSLSVLNVHNLTQAISESTLWKKYDRKSREWYQSDPPNRHITILYEQKVYEHLPPLVSLARQPFYRESDNELITEPGYDPISKRYGVFNPDEFIQSDPTLERAQIALDQLRELLQEFSFVRPIDEAVALSAIFTAVTRASLNLAPGFHVHASVFASGKSYLCELISAFTGPGLSEKISYPKTAEEAAKVILALLLKNPACVEFDDMDTDWTPHSVIKRMFTTEEISERILGVSKTATVGTRTLFLGSGNNVMPVRDLLRRVMVIHLDPRVETPATRKYRSTPVATVRENRGKFVMAVMTIIQAWREAGSPKTEVKNIASYDAQWSDYCRHPLIWLGLPDPAEALIQQVTNDSDKEALRELLKAWFETFESTPTTVRKVLASVSNSYSLEERENKKLYDAICEFPVVDRGNINRSKFGWILKKNANRIIDGLEFRKASADGRTAWQVVEVKTGEEPALLS